jgi:hypothetical protein
MRTNDQFKGLFLSEQKISKTQTILNQCSNVRLRLPRVRGLSASMVEQTTFINKEQSNV